jgi:hypothetical protein
MNCACVCIDTDFDPVKIISITNPVSRTRRRCKECRRIIEKGEAYQAIKYSCDGRASMHTICSECENIREIFFCEGSVFTSLMEDLETHIFDIGGQVSSECLLSLSPKARNIVFGIIEAAWAEFDEE